MVTQTATGSHPTKAGIRLTLTQNQQKQPRKSLRSLPKKVKREGEDVQERSIGSK